MKVVFSILGKVYEEHSQITSLHPLTLLGARLITDQVIPGLKSAGTWLPSAHGVLQQQQWMPQPAGRCPAAVGSPFACPGFLLL